MFLFVNIYFKLCDPVLHKISYNFSLSRIFQKFSWFIQAVYMIGTVVLYWHNVCESGYYVHTTYSRSMIFKTNSIEKARNHFFHSKYFSTRQAKFLLCDFSSQDAENRWCLKG